MTTRDVDALIRARYPRPDQAAELDWALSAAEAIARGSITLEDTGKAWTSTRSKETMARARMTGAIIASTGTEQSLADRAGTTRPTIRKALGK